MVMAKPKKKVNAGSYRAPQHFYPRRFLLRSMGFFWHVRALFDENPILPHSCICTYRRKIYFLNYIKIRKNIDLYFKTFYACTRIVAKKYYFFMARTKKKILVLQNSFLERFFLSFLHRRHKKYPAEFL
jgi:hypothetical protein